MPQPVRVLVAEDEEPIRLALTTLARKHLGCDEVVGCAHGADAWERLRSEPFSLVISDWNMPEKSGYELLQAMRAHALTRDIPVLLLTARSDKASVLDAIKAGVDDYITKPFDKALLIQKARKLLARATGDGFADRHTAPAGTANATQALVDEVTRRFRNREITLPVLPDLARSLESLLARENVAVDELVRLVQTDPGITSRLMAIANSAQYRGGTEVKTLEQAVMRIGLQMTGNYALALSQRSLFAADAGPFKAMLADLWRHSLATAEAAHLLARHLGLKDPDSCYTMGLLHDIGKLVLIRILAEMAPQQPAITEAETVEALYRLHGEFGAALLAEWHFPAQMCQVARHHEDVALAPTITTALLVVALANLVAQRAGYANGDPPDASAELQKLAQRLQLGQSVIQETIEQVRAALDGLKAIV